MPEEHVGQLGFDYAWKELLKRAQATRTFRVFLHEYEALMVL
jgi:hypothetical protein